MSQKQCTQLILKCFVSKNAKHHLSLQWVVIFLLVESENESRLVVSDSLWPHGLYSPWNSPGQNTGVGSLSLLQGIFPVQGLNPGLPHCGQILYQLLHKGIPRIPEWVADPFSRRSSWPRNQLGVSCIAGGFFTTWATRVLVTGFEIFWQYPKCDMDMQSEQMLFKNSW